MRNSTNARLKRTLLALLLVGISTFLLYSPPSNAATANLETISQTKIKAEFLKSKIKEVAATTDLDAETKAKLTELYHKALSNLEATRTHKAAELSFIQAKKKALGEAKTILKNLERAKKPPSKDRLKIDKNTPTSDIEQMLLNEKANSAAVEAKLAGYEDKLVFETQRPTIVRQQLTEAKYRLQSIAAELKIPLVKEGTPLLNEAKRWILQSENLVLSAKIKALDKELLSQPMRIELLKAKREKTARDLKTIDTRILLAEDLVNQRRRAEAEEVIAQTDAATLEAVGKHPIIQKVAQDNALLSEELSSLANTRQGVTNEVDRANKESKQINADFQSARQKLEIAGLGQVLGQVLQEQRRNLPDLRLYRKQTKRRENLSIEIGLQLIRNKEERRRLQDMDAHIARLTKDFSIQETEQVSIELGNLLEIRLQILEKIIATNNAYLRELAELDVAQRNLLDSAVAYDEFLAERLLWLRSTPAIDLAAFRELPGEINRLLSLTLWFEVIGTIINQLTHAPFFAILLILFAVLLWYKRQIKRALTDTAKNLGKISTDRLTYTMQAIGYTLLLSITWPLIMLIIGWQLLTSLEASEFPRAVGLALVYTSLPFFSMRVFRVLCIPNGLAAAHFQWSNSSLKLIRRQLNRLLVVFLPAYFIAITAANLQPITLGGTIVKLSFVMSSGALAYFLFRVLHPRKGALHNFYIRHPNHPTKRFKFLWFSIVVAMPFVLIVFSLAGYVYTANTLTGLLFATLWLLLALLVLEQLTERWLLLTRRKLALQAALERRAAAKAATESKDNIAPADEDGLNLEVEEPSIDLVALSEESRKLVNTALVIIGVVGLWIIWSGVLPAFGVLSDVSIWHHTVIIDSIEKIEPITLADLGLAILFGFLTVVLSRSIPTLLEIVLLKNIDITSGSRYAVTTLSSYTIVATGIIVIWYTIGGEWQQIQWLAAALSLGIGFGLQEIVANFISGIIILFERPIRVGDVVTVGDTDGVVTRIQIRATTIRNWDRKELLVPNKEFITGRLLNWTLSDQVTRTIVTVGVAYGSDVDKALDLMLDAAKEQEHVLEDPEPRVTFEEFGDSALVLRLRAYIPSIEYRISTISGLHKSINRKFNQANISIAYPQMDVHLDTRKAISINRDQGNPETSLN